MNLLVSPSVTNQTTTIFNRIYEFARKQYGEKYELLAWNEFIPIEGVEYPSNSYVMDIFWPWYMYSRFNDGENIAYEFMLEDIRNRTDVEKLFIGSCIQNKFSFYEVKRVQYGENIVVKDLLSGKEIFVFEKSASRQLSSGDIIFGKIAEVFELHFLATASIRIPAMYRAEIISFNRKKKIKENELNRIDKYFEILDSVLIEDMETYNV